MAFGVVGFAPRMPRDPLVSPLPASLFGPHLRVAAESAHAAGEPLSLVVMRGVFGGRRGRERLHAVLRDIPGFAYELQPGGYAILMPGGTAWTAFKAALFVRCDARGGLLRSGAVVDAGIAELEPWMGPEDLFRAAADALYDAEDTGSGAIRTHHRRQPAGA
jgi:hypothetical protein